jgi:hypothetical protein
MTVNRVVDTAEEKARLSQFADVVDMESLHVVRQFDEEQIPVAVIRAISDGSEEEMPVDFEKVLTADGAIRVVPLLKDLMKEPGKIPAVIRFGRQSRAAAEKLARFLDEYIQALTPELLKVHATEGISE